MNETEFIDRLVQYRLEVRPAILPTSLETVLYGHKFKTKVISETDEKIFYKHVKPMTCDSEDYKQWKTEMGWSDVKVAKHLQGNYEQYLKTLKKHIREIHGAWKDSWRHQRVRLLQDQLGWLPSEAEAFVAYEDMCTCRVVPIELVLQYVFAVKTAYGECRTKLTNKDVVLHPKIVKYLADKKEFNSRTTVHARR